MQNDCQTMTDKLDSKIFLSSEPITESCVSIEVENLLDCLRKLVFLVLY
jgi:hypothetical protein